MKKLITLSLLLLGTQCVLAQSNFVSRFIRRMYFKTDSSKKPGFVLLPAISSAPETGLEVGGAALVSFYTDTLDKITNVSSIYGYATVTTKGQTKLSGNLSYWTPKNKIHYLANTSFYNFPFDFYGVGNNTKYANQELLFEKRYKASFGNDFLVAKNLYLGYVLGAFKYYYRYDKGRTDILNTDPDIQDKRGGAAAYIGPSINYDTRNNNTYTTKGMVITAYYNLMHGAFINNGYEGGFFNIEYSEFFALSKKFVLGTDIQEQSLTGGSSPFYLLPQMGSDEMMRGYYQGRYRDRNYIAAQTELRYRLSPRVGFVVFAGTGEVFHTSFNFSQLKPDFGTGVRYFFDVEKGLSVRLDYGVGEKPVGEPRESGVYIALGQSF